MAGSAGAAARGDAAVAAAPAPQGNRPLGAWSGGARQAATRRLRRHVVGQERAHLAARDAVALLSAGLRSAGRRDARVRQPAPRQPGDPARVVQPRQLCARLHQHLGQQVAILFEKGPAAGARSARRRGVAVLSMEVPDAAGQADAERLPRARRHIDVRLHDEPGRRAAEDHRFPGRLGARAAEGAAIDAAALRGHAGRPGSRAAPHAGLSRHAVQRAADPRGRGLCVIRQPEEARAEQRVRLERHAPGAGRRGEPAVLQGAPRQGRRLARLFRRAAGRGDLRAAGGAAGAAVRLRRAAARRAARLRRGPRR